MVNDAYDFGIGRRLRNLEHLEKIGFAANRRLLDVQRVSHDCAVGAEAFDDMHRPGTVDGQRVSALRFGDRRVQALCAALLSLHLLPGGFRNRDLRETVAPLLELDLDSYRQGRATCAGCGCAVRSSACRAPTDIVGRARQGCLDRIQKTLDTLEHKGRDGRRTPPNWRKELQHVQGGAGPWQDVSVNCDVYVSESSELPGLAFELKAPLPNSDQTKVSKEKLLKLHCMNPRPVKQAYFALPYNPYGSRERYDWSFPGRWFNMREDPCVLIGDELWDKLGGKKSYAAIVEIANRVGQRYKRRIYEDYLGIPAPQELA